MKSQLFWCFVSNSPDFHHWFVNATNIIYLISLYLLVWGLSILFLSFICLFLCQYHSSLIMIDVIPCIIYYPSLSFPPKIVWAFLVLILFHMLVYISVRFHKKNSCGDLLGMVMSSQITLGRMETFPPSQRTLGPTWKVFGAK